MRTELERIWQQYGLKGFKHQCYAYTRFFEHSCVLDSCELTSGVHEGKYELLAAYGAEKLVGSLEELEASYHRDWIFGVFSYDLKNRFEKLESQHPEYIAQDELALFVPETIIAIERGGKPRLIKGKLNDHFFEDWEFNYQSEGLRKLNDIDPSVYKKNIIQIKDWIRQGVVYELNYCVQHRYAFEVFDPLAFHAKLIKHSPVPMASYFKWGKRHLAGASMERYLAKVGNRLFSQPIKGTIRKGRDKIEDEQLMIALYQSEKERAENVMIVDLVRNDLARICEAGSIRVDELFGIYSYLQLHQMISTVSGMTSEASITAMLRASFPMGSMTGAPKISAMQHIEQLEDFKRAWYSGALGYMEPSGDFDFNVVIRSLICDRENNQLAYSAGGAITIDSVPEGEWHECLLKTKAIEHILIP